MQLSTSCNSIAFCFFMTCHGYFVRYRQVHDYYILFVDCFIHCEIPFYVPAMLLAISSNFVIIASFVLFSSFIPFRTVLGVHVWCSHRTGSAHHNSGCACKFLCPTAWQRVWDTVGIDRRLLSKWMYAYWTPIHTSIPCRDDASSGKRRTACPDNPLFIFFLICASLYMMANATPGCEPRVCVQDSFGPLGIRLQRPGK